MNTGDSSPNVFDLRHGDVQAWGAALTDLEPRLRRMIAIRLDPRLRGRIDVDDVIQDSFLESSQRRDEFLGRDDPLPLIVWLRWIVLQKLNQLHRFHLGTQSRDAGREISLESPANQATSAALAARLLGEQTTPSQALLREEAQQVLKQAFDELDDMDQEIIALRNFEQLSNQEAASTLDLDSSVTSSRYFRAVRRLKSLLAEYTVRTQTLSSSRMPKNK